MDTDKNYLICVHQVIFMKKEFFHKNLTQEILGAAFEVHNPLGCGFLEKVYKNSLIEKLFQRGIKCKS